MNPPATEPRPISIAEGVVVVSTVLAFPIGLYLVHRAPAAAVLYPAINFLLAGYLFLRRSPWYAGHIVLVFCFVSLVRRLVDAQAGWNPSNPVLLTPYLCCLFATLGFVRYWLKPHPRFIGVFLCMLACITYGVVVALCRGRTLAALVDALKWGFGPIFSVYVLSEADTHMQLRRVVVMCLVWAGGLMGLYGIAQFVLMPQWDAQWMRNVIELGLDSIGQPEPFAVRVFSTMNSPGSFGIMLMAAIVVALKRNILITALIVPLMLVGVALCQYRSLWAATAVAMIMVVMPRRAALPGANVVALAAMAIVALCSLAAVPRIQEALMHRASSLSTLNSDQSLKSRLAQYADLAHDDNLIGGEGLAINGASRRLDKGPSVAIDGAFIEVWRGLGVLVGSGFLLCIGILAGSLLFMPPGVDSEFYFDRAIVIGTFIQLPIGSVHMGEMGFCAWMFLGFALAELSRRRTSAIPSQARTYPTALGERMRHGYETADA
jgi:hypothetical protein